MSLTSRADELTLSPQDKKAAFHEIKAVRQRRIAEKAELQDLNTRLEIVLNHLESRDRRIADLVAERDELMAELNGRSSRWSKTLDEASQTWEANATRIKAENRELVQATRELREENARLKSERGNAQTLIKELQATVGQVDTLRTKLQAQEKKFELQLQNMKEQLTEKDKALRDREEKALARENKLKQDLEEQRLQDIKAVEERCEMDRQQQIEKFRLDWNRQTSEKDRLIDQLKNEVANLRDELEARNKEMNLLQKQLHDALQRVEEAQRTRNSLRNQNDEEIQKLRLEIQEMGNAFARKNLQFDELMEQKIALQQEIEMYRTLVSRAERANELQTPPKKRYRPDTTIFGSAPQPSRRRVHLQFSGGDVEEGYVELLNHNRASASLSGLVLRASTGASLRLNTKQDTLGGNKTLRVYLKAKANMPSSALLWDNAWDGKSKCEVKVMNQRGQTVCGLTLDPAMFGDEDGRDACFVM